ncbi:MFS transporter [Chitinophaga agrisoli]|uniref:MFS transporter n=1 Tax=Chitinophaga agrisoli TaxID=2607653 RepID=A0A5B2VMZ4_9BACT|nr:MFS transporter [Chitinophaga agrisoli]
MDVFIINVAIPAIKKGVHATDGEIQLVIAGYLLGYAAFLITGGRAGDHFGRKKVFFWGMLAFTVASCLCGLSMTPLQLNVTRFFQGVSASFMVPQTIAYIQVIFTGREERTKAIGYFGITLGIAAMIGQFLGGYLSDSHFAIEGWRLIFFINLPVGIAALWTTHRYLEETPKNNTSVFDYSGVGILTVGLVALIYPLIQGRESGWPLWSILMLGGAALVFVYFIRHQRRKLFANKAPLVNVRLFRFKDFNLGLLTVLFFFMLHTAYLLIITVYLQGGLGFSAFDCGLFFIAMGIMFTIASMLSIHYVVKYGKRVLQVGVVIMIAALIMELLVFGFHANHISMLVLMAIYGLGSGLVLPSLLNMALKSVPVEFAGAAAGVYSTFQQTASALGISIIGGVFFFFVETGDYTKAFDYGMVANIICAVIVGVLLYLLPDKREVAAPAGNTAVSRAPVEEEMIFE